MSEEAHVILLVRPNGCSVDVRVHGVHLGRKAEAEQVAEALNLEAGYDERDKADGFWWGTHYKVETTPVWGTR